MASTIQCGRRTREDFGKIPSIVEIPNLIEIQRRSYEQFLQKDVAPERREETGLQAVFKSVFPIADYNDNALLEFDSYHFGDPKYTVEECHDRGMTFAIPLKVTLRLVVYDHDKEAKTRTIREQRGQEVYLGELPLMTEKGTFIINGTERVVVSQLQRSAGVFFDDDKGKTVASGKLLYSARVIPYRGSWVEFEFDANDILFVRVDRRRKMLATAFLRLNKRTSENGSIDEEYRVEYMVDRTNTVGTTFLGLTVGCARCHDHKYDPISQKDFYSLGAFFNNTDEPGYYTPGSTGVTAGPTLAWSDPATDATLAAANAGIRRAKAAYEDARATARREAAAATGARTAADIATRVQQSLAAGLVAYYPFEETAPVPDDRLPSSRERNRRPSPPPLAPETLVRPPATPPTAGPGARPPVRIPSDLVRDALTSSPSATPGIGPAVLESASLKDGVKGRAFYFDDTNRGVLAPGVGDFDRTQPFSLDLWILAPKVYEDAMVLNNRENDFFGNAGYQLNLVRNQLRFDLMHSRAGNRIVVTSKAAVPTQRWSHVTITYDGSSRATGVALYIDGARADVEIISDNLTRSTLPNGGGTLGDEYLGLQFGKRFRMTALVGGAIDEIRVFKTALTPLEVAQLQSGAVGRPTEDAVMELWVASDPRVTTAAAQLAVAREAENQIISRTPEVMVMGDARVPRPSYVLLRGQYTDHGEQVTPRGLSQIFPWDEALPPNRLGLARWLFDPAHPLTARVFMNRLWQLQFGRALVETAEDFGTQGQVPSHPELLDWLAVSFRDSGWNVKRMVKQMVMSATYRQRSVVSDDLLKKDPTNVLLARFSRVRMPAEMVRDNALAASGLLVAKPGGPSAYPYQPDGIWDGLSGYVYPTRDGVPDDDQHRRTMYSFIKRNAPHPALAAFDMPDRGSTTVRRQTSNTPLQALVLLDDPQFLEAYRVLAQRVMKGTPDRDSQLTMMFRLATRRRPMPSELGPMRAYYDAQVRRYTGDPGAATALITVGVAPVDPAVDPARLAALMNVTASVMNTGREYAPTWRPNAAPGLYTSRSWNRSPITGTPT